MTKEVLVVLTDRWADWEASYAIAVINSVPAYTVKIGAEDKSSKVSIGGLRTEVDHIISDYDNFENLAMVILPGGFSWGDEDHKDIINFLQKAHQFNIPIAAICGATIFLGKNGFLNHIKHTGDDKEFFEAEPGYNGHENFVSAQIVVDTGFITANETAAVDFAYEIFKTLKVDTPEEIEMWFDKFKNGMVR